MKVFTYGSLLNNNNRLLVLGREVDGTKDILIGYEKIPHSKFYVYPTIKENKNSLVEGMVFDVSEEDMKNLDRYETHLYRRLEVILQSGVKALAYIENH
jgi:gamma-glutamylcyclotransferase (GGCT)/AIG2-like uncharacterized protein YtfP